MCRFRIHVIPWFTWFFYIFSGFNHPLFHILKSYSHLLFVFASLCHLYLARTRAAPMNLDDGSVPHFRDQCNMFRPPRIEI